MSLSAKKEHEISSRARMSSGGHLAALSALLFADNYTKIFEEIYGVAEVFERYYI